MSYSTITTQASVFFAFLFLRPIVNSILDLVLNYHLNIIIMQYRLILLALLFNPAHAGQFSPFPVWKLQQQFSGLITSSYQICHDYEKWSEKYKFMDLSWLGLIVPASYILISTFFLCFPNILHRRHRYKYPPFNDLIDSNSTFCIGHRGGGWEGPENTIELFERNDKRLHMFQLDVCLTKDKKLVVHHDSNLLRTCGINKDVSQCNYEELPTFMPQFKSFGGPILKSKKNKIPLLQQVFTKFPEKPMNIQLKYATEEGISQFARLVRKYDRQNITVWGAAGSLNQKLREANPNTVNFYSAGEVLKLYFLFLIGLLPFVCVRQGVLDIPLYTDGFYKMAMNFTQSKCFKCLIFVVFLILRCFNFFSCLFIPHLKKRGILTFYFILNEEEEFDSALSKGSSGIMTDSSEKLQNYLKRKGIFYVENNSPMDSLANPGH